MLLSIFPTSLELIIDILNKQLYSKIQSDKKIGVCFMIVCVIIGVHFYFISKQNQIILSQK